MSAATTSASRIADRTMEVIPTGAVLGAEIRGVDLKALDEAAFAHLIEAWHQHSVLLVRDQALSDHNLITFSCRFGELDWAPIQDNGRRFVEGMPEIYIVSNVKVNGRNSLGSTSGASAISCCGTTAAPCIGATPSIRAPDESCIAPRSRASSGPLEAGGA